MRARTAAGAQYQEGQEPAEDAAALLVEAEAALDELQSSGGGHGYRRLRSELRRLAALPVAELRSRADRVARDVRALDTRIRRANREVDLLD